MGLHKVGKPNLKWNIIVIRLRRWFEMKKGIVLVLLIMVCIWNYYQNDLPDQDPFAITNYARLHPVKVGRVVKGREEEQLIGLIKERSIKYHNAHGRDIRNGSLIKSVESFRLLNAVTS
jgi:hypothetical protein